MVRRVAEGLQSCNAGVLIVTSENKYAPWLHFEAGAVSKDIEESNVIPLLWGISVGELSGTPLAQFQSEAFDETGVRSACQTLGKLFDIDPGTIVRRFQTNWPAFEKQLKKVGSTAPTNERDPTIADVVALVQRLSAQIDDVDSRLKTMNPSRSAGGIFGALSSRPLTLGDVARLSESTSPNTVESSSELLRLLRTANTSLSASGPSLKIERDPDHESDNTKG